jgi:hypothetical protein
VPDQSHVVHVSGFPYEWTTTRVLEVFAGTWGPLNVQWIVRLSLSLHPHTLAAITCNMSMSVFVCVCVCECMCMMDVGVVDARVSGV